MSLTDEVKKKMQQAVDHLKDELKTLRTGRANPALLDGVEVEIYGSKMRLKNIASVATPEARTLLITPFDPTNVAPICKSIEKANLNLQPVADKNVVRINVPPMDAAMRQERVKQARKKGEDTKIQIRNIRRDYNELVKKQKSAGEMAEDAVKRLEKQIQELTDKYCKESDEIVAAKEKDILEI